MFARYRRRSRRRYGGDTRRARVARLSMPRDASSAIRHAARAEAPL